MSIVIILTGPGNPNPPPPPPPPPGAREAAEADSLTHASTGETIVVFHEPNAARRARKYLKALEE